MNNIDKMVNMCYNILMDLIKIERNIDRFVEKMRYVIPEFDLGMFVAVSLKEVLTERQYEIFYLHLQRGLSLNECARYLSITSAAAYDRYITGVNALARECNRQLPHSYLQMPVL